MVLAMGVDTVAIMGAMVTVVTMVIAVIGAAIG